MALSLKNPESERSARSLAKRTGKSITEALTMALQDKLKRERTRNGTPGLAAKLMEISRHCAALPDLDTRTPDEILGYDENVLPR
jgi:antitoxin VapB